EHGVAAEVNGVVEVVVEDLIHLARPDTTGQERADDGAGAAADVDVEAAARAIEPLFERRQGANLIHAADDTAAGKGQRVTRPLSGPPSPEGPMYELHLASHQSK